MLLSLIAYPRRFARSVAHQFGSRGLTAAMAFLTRSVRQDSRLVSHHGMRAAMAILILYLFFVQTQLSATRSAVGATFASTVITCCYCFLTLLGGIHFSSAISEEKDEQTLALLKMTGASPFSILLGKSLPRLAVAVLFLAVIAPFLLLSITLGGVLRLGLLSAITGILCYSVMLSQLGLFASVFSSTTKKAFSLTCILWALFEFPLVWATMLYSVYGYCFGYTRSAAVDDFFGYLSQLGAFTHIRSDLLAFNPTEIWHPHMAFQLSVAAVFFVLSWLLFEPCTSRAVGEGTAEPGRRRLFAFKGSAGRVWSNAVMWKSWQQDSGGFQWMIIRLFLAPLLIFGFGTAFSVIASGKFYLESVIGWGLGLGIAYLLITTARLLGRLFNEEVHGKTLSSLVMLPQKESSTFWSLVGGLAPAVSAAALTAVVSFVLLILYILSTGSVQDVGELFRGIFQPWFWHFFSWTIVTVHLGVLLTTYVRYGGMLLSVAICWFAMPLVCSVSFGMLAFAGSIGTSGGVEFFQYLIPLGLIFAESIACVVIQRSIHKRLIELAAK